jgi:hypothetical protein
MHMRKEMNYDVQTSKFKLKYMQQYEHMFFSWTMYIQKVVKSCETFLLSFSIHNMIPCQNLQFSKKIEILLQLLDYGLGI